MASENKGILFCSVLKGDKVLSHYSSVDGNFIEFSRKVLEKANNTSRDKATYTSGRLAFAEYHTSSHACMRVSILLVICCTICEMVQ